MQIATPTQAPSSFLESGSSTESGISTERASAKGVFGDSPGVWGNKRGARGAARNKNGLGIFAKLLQNLAVKGKKGGGEARELKGRESEDPAVSALAPGFENVEAAPDAQNPANVEKDGFAAAFGSLKTGNSGTPREISIDGAVAPAELALLRGKLNAERGRESAGAGAEDAPSAKNAARIAAEKDGPADGSGLSHTLKFPLDETGLRGGDPSGLAAGAEGEAPDAFSGVSPEPGSGESAETLLLSGGGKAKNARSASAEFQSAAAGNEGGAPGSLESVPGRDPPGALTAGTGAGDDSPRREVRGKKGRERPGAGGRDSGISEIAAAESGSGGAPSVSGGTPLSDLKTGTVEIDVPVDLEFSAERAEAGKSGGESRSRFFEDALASELRGNLSSDIVRDAAVIVRNGGGTIKLSLHPESLGNVKIRLEMAENKITGHIIVESSEALRAFERELPVLEKAFRDSGFREAALDMSLAQDGGNGESGGRRREDGFSALMPAMAASRYEGGAGRMEDAPLPGGLFPAAAPDKTSVNLLI